MDNQTLEIIKISISILTPALIAVFGFAINRTLERNKTAAAKEKEWQSWWAGKFLEVAHDLSLQISEYVTTLFTMAQMSDDRRPHSKIGIEQTNATIHEISQRIRHLEWEIKNYVQFASKEGPKTIEALTALLELISDLIKTKHGDLEVIHKAQFVFNDCIRSAHAEILGISFSPAGRTK